MRTRWAFLLVAALVGPSCGDDKNDTLSPLVFCDQYAKTACDELTAACLISPTECIANRTSECVAVGRAATSQSQVFIPANAKACLSKVGEVYGKLKEGTIALKPADLAAMNEVCALIYRGKAKRNQSCSTDADCEGDLICDKWHCGSPSVVAPGLGCANIGQYCTPGYYCGDPDGVLACVPKAAATAACTDTLPCLESLRCSAGVCTEDLPIGEACAADEDCATDFCEPYAGLCAADVRFANGTAACTALKAVRGTGPGPVFP